MIKMYRIPIEYESLVLINLTKVESFAVIASIGTAGYFFSILKFLVFVY